MLNLKKIIGQSIISGFKYKISSILIGLVILPTFYRDLGQINFGYYALFISISTWINNLDFGLANASRQKLTRAFDNKNFDKLFSEIKLILSATTVLSLILIVIVISVYVQFQSTFENSVFKSNPEIAKFFIFASCINITNFIGAQHRTLNLACHDPSKVYSSTFCSQILSISTSLIIIKFNSNVGWVLIASSISNLFINLIFLYNFLSKYKFKNYIKTKVASFSFDFYKTGLIFFIIQILTLGINNLDAISINKYLGSAELANYTILQRIYTLLITMFTIFILPFWSIFASAVAERNHQNFRKADTYINYGIVLIFVILLSLTIFADRIASMWIGFQFNSSIYLRISFAFFVFIKCVIDSKVNFLNSIEKINGQAIVLFIGLAINLLLISKLHTLGSYGIVLSNVFSLLPMLIFVLISYRKQKSEFLNRKI